MRGNLFHLNTNKEPLTLPEAVGTLVTLSEKLYVPVKEYPDVSMPSTTTDSIYIILHAATSLNTVCFKSLTMCTVIN